MATVAQIQRGFTRFVDNHLSGAFEGWQKAVVIGGATLLAANVPNLVRTYGNSPFVAALGVYNPEAGTWEQTSFQLQFQESEPSNWAGKI